MFSAPRRKASHSHPSHTPSYSLSLYYRYVYPWLAVLLPPGHLSTYAFFFSEGRPSALLSAIAACVAVCCREHEAKQTIRSSVRRQYRLRQRNGNTGSGHTSLAPPGDDATREEIARYHCRTAEILLEKDRELLRSFEQSSGTPGSSGGGGLSPSSARGPAKRRGPKRPLGRTNSGAGTPGGAGASNAPGGGEVDVELLKIEKAATRVLLAHYHYGAGADATHRLAFSHAKKAWTLSSQFNLDRPESSKTDDHAGYQGGFGRAERCEWMRRVHWLAYTAATHLSCLGGFVSRRSGLRKS